MTLLTNPGDRRHSESRSYSWPHVYGDQIGEYMENCRLRTTVAKISTQFAYRFLSRVEASADFSPNEKPKWPMLNEVFDRASVKVACELICLGVIILVLCSSPLLAESANSDFKRGESAEAREDYDTAYDLYQNAVAKDPKT